MKSEKRELNYKVNKVNKEQQDLEIAGQKTVGLRAILISMVSVYIITVILMNSKLFNLIPEFDTWRVPSELAVGVLLALLLLNIVLRLFKAKVALSRVELMSIYNMVTAGTLIVSIGVFFYFVFELVAIQREVEMGGMQEVKSYFANMSAFVIPQG